MNPLPFKAVFSLAVANLMFQAAPIPGSFDAAGRLTLDAALVVAVGVLWRALGSKDQRIAEKDGQVVAMATKATETMALVMEAVKELRGSVNELREEHGAPKSGARRA